MLWIERFRPALDRGGAAEPQRWPAVCSELLGNGRRELKSLGRVPDPRELARRRRSAWVSDRVIVRGW